MYSTGTATGLADLLDKLKTFCEANGWTSDAYTTQGTGKRWHAHHSNGNYVNFRSFLNETPDTGISTLASGSGCYGLAFNVGTGYSGGTDWFAQAGVPVGTSSKYMTAGFGAVFSAIPSYHFFSHNSGADIKVIIESAAGQFQHLGFGELTKFSTFTGGTYFWGSRQGVNNAAFSLNNYLNGVGFFSSYSSAPHVVTSAFVDVAVDSETAWHWGADYASDVDTSRRRVLDNFAKDQTATLDLMPNTINGLTPLNPVIVSVYRDAASLVSSSGWSPLGSVPYLFYTSIQGLTPGQQIAYGGDSYRVFPFATKGSAPADPSANPLSSAYYAFAVAE